LAGKNPGPGIDIDIDIEIDNQIGSRCRGDNGGKV
jgi:hypothetical protein